MINSIKQLLILIRVNNWIKNLMIFLPVFFAGKLQTISNEKFASLLLTFFAFSFVSSFIYILNDIVDREKDKLHTEKCKRPIASGFFSIKHAIIISVVILCIASGFLSFLNFKISLVIISYLVLNVLYCFYLKNIPIVDVTCISLGFVLRIISGGLAAEVLITHWILIMIFLLMFSVALAKRRDDLVMSRNNDNIYRKSQKGYNLQFIDSAKVISFSVTLVAYILYSVSADVMERIGSQYIYLTALPVFLGIMRYLQLSIVEENTGSPVKLLYKDTFLIIMILMWITIFSILIYE